MSEKKEVLTPQEVERLILALADTRKEKPFTEAEATLLIQWAAEARTNNALLELLLAGHVRVDVADGKVVFSRGERPEN